MRVIAWDPQGDVLARAHFYALNTSNQALPLFKGYDLAYSNNDQVVDTLWSADGTMLFALIGDTKGRMSVRSFRKDTSLTSVSSSSSSPLSSTSSDVSTISLMVSASVSSSLASSSSSSSSSASSL